MTGRRDPELSGDHVTLLGGLEYATEQLRELRMHRDNLIAAAVKAGIPQTRVAAAAGTSQAHVSRLVNRPRPARRDRGRRSAGTAGGNGEQV